jgi:hypothetical protein
LLGYELYIQRARRLEARGLATPGLRALRGAGWEEAMRAWRVVQPTFFRFLYIVGSLNLATIEADQKQRRTFRGMLQNQFLRHRPEVLRDRLSNTTGAPVQMTGRSFWFEPRSLLHPSAEYYSGGYLQTILNVIYVVTAICMVPAIAACVLLWMKGSALEASALTATAVVAATFTINRFRLTNARRKLLESGLLSIHSSSIVWQVAMTCHFRALDSLTAGPEGAISSYAGYSKALSTLAVDAAESVADIYRWLANNRQTEKVLSKEPLPA